MDGHMGLGGGAWAELTDHQHGLGRSSAPPATHTHTRKHSRTWQAQADGTTWSSSQEKACKLKVIPSRFEALPAQGGTAALAHLLIGPGTSGLIFPE